MRRLWTWWRLRGTETWVERRVGIWLTDPGTVSLWTRVR